MQVESKKTEEKSWLKEAIKMDHVAGKLLFSLKESLENNAEKVTKNVVSIDTLNLMQAAIGNKLPELDIGFGKGKLVLTTPDAGKDTLAVNHAFYMDLWGTISYLVAKSPTKVDDMIWKYLKYLKGIEFGIPVNE